VVHFILGKVNHVVLRENRYLTKERKPCIV
jgi:hypothetical protein